MSNYPDDDKHFTTTDPNTGTHFVMSFGNKSLEPHEVIANEIRLAGERIVSCLFALSILVAIVGAILIAILVSLGGTQ